MAYCAQVNRLAMAMALIQPLLPAASYRVISVTSIRGKSEYPGHYPLPFFPVGADFLAKQFVGQKMCHLMSDSLPDKVLAVFLKQHLIKAKLMFFDPRLTRCLSGQVQPDIRFPERLLKKAFCFLVKLKNPLFNLVKVVLQWFVCPLCLCRKHSGMPGIVKPVNASIELSWFILGRQVRHQFRQGIDVQLITILH